MKNYDANKEHICNICEKTFKSNKNGSFTSHLLKEHNLKLDEYLLKHFYSINDLKCRNNNCNNTVGLYRGKRKDFCGKKHEKELICLICKNKYNNKRNKTCSKQCTSILRSNIVKEWHKKMPQEMKLKHFNNIVSKTSNTRRSNKTPSWNSGKTNIYSKETIEKIRLATLSNFEKGIFKKTKPERIIEDLLKNLNLKYKYSFILDKKQYDFFLPQYKTIIECDGDYWHVNPKFFPNPEKNWQIDRINNDKEKNKIAISNGYFILRFWENDIVNNLDDVKQKIMFHLQTISSQDI